MRSWLSGLFGAGAGKGRRCTPSPRRARLGVEALEHREVLTATGLAAVQLAPALGPPTAPSANSPQEVRLVQSATDALKLRSLTASPPGGATSMNSLGQAQTSFAASLIHPSAPAGIEALARFHADQAALATPADAADPGQQGPASITSVVVAQDQTKLPLPALQQIRDSITKNRDTIIQNATDQLTAQINKRLPDGGTGDWSVKDLKVNLPQTLDDSNSELDATVNPDGTVQLDLTLKGVSGSLGVAVPQGVKDGIGAASGAAIGGGIFGPIGGLVGAGIGAIAGTQLDDPRFDFTTDIHVRIKVPEPFNLVQSAVGIAGHSALTGFFEKLAYINTVANNYALPDGAIQEEATNIQVHGQNAVGDAATLANKVAGFIPSSVVMDKIDPSITASANSSVGQLAGFLQIEQQYGPAPVQVSLDGQGNLVYNTPGQTTLAGLDNPPPAAPPSNAPPVFLH